MKTYAEIQQFLNQNRSKIEALPELKIAVLRNITVEATKPYIEYSAYQIGFNARVHFGKYDNVYQESTRDTAEQAISQADIILIFTKLETLSPVLSNYFAKLDKSEIENEIERLDHYFHNVLHGIRNQTSGMVLWHGFEIPSHPVLGIWDSQTNWGQTNTIMELNQALKRQLSQYSNAYFVDMDSCLRRVGYAQYYDKRYWHIAKSPYTRMALEEIVREDFKFIRALKGKHKKCLVLDCDGVLWGGVIGEDGLAGIEIGTSYPGSIYYEWQHTLVNLYHRGVILALCSKNNPDDVWEVFRNHPDMVLKEEHIATAQINWQDKAANLRQIAADLNIGLESIVFVDDNLFEVNLIRQELPEITTLHFDKRKAASFSQNILVNGWFDTLTITDEDKRRGQMYKAEVSRKKIRVQSTDMTEYYRSLELVATVQFATEFTIPRIAQLTQKTNQFNLTTKRYSEADILNFSNSPNADVLSLRLSDKFGDLGIVGVCILTYEENTKSAYIDTFLFSCRALGRRAEDVLLAQSMWLAKYRGSQTIIGTYIPTKKNEQTKMFYASHQFETVKTFDDGHIIYIRKLSDYQYEPIETYADIISDVTNYLR